MPAPAGGPAAGPSFVPAVRDTGPARIGRDVSMTDLETARAAVADLAAASSVVYPGLEWAVAVARGASGVAELWVITNEGSGYIRPVSMCPAQSTCITVRIVLLHHETTSNPTTDQRGCSSVAKLLSPVGMNLG